MEWQQFVYLIMFALSTFEVCRLSRKIKEVEKENKLLIEENTRLNNKVNADAK